MRFIQKAVSAALFQPTDVQLSAIKTFANERQDLPFIGT